MEALARHVRDVDARHSGKWFGKGTRHGVQHWSCGDHEERQTIFTEQRYHYLLTGDRRTFEWNEQLTRDWYLKEPVSYAPTHAGRLYGLFCRWEWTGDPALGELLRRYVYTLAQPKGISINPLVEFPSVRMVKALTQKEDHRVFRPRGVFSAFFHHFGGMHALLEYYELTGDARVKRSIIETARRHLDEPSHLALPVSEGHRLRRPACRGAGAFPALPAGLGLWYGLAAGLSAGSGEPRPLDRPHGLFCRGEYGRQVLVDGRALRDGGAGRRAAAVA